MVSTFTILSTAWPSFWYNPGMSLQKRLHQSPRAEEEGAESSSPVSTGSGSEEEDFFRRIVCGDRAAAALLYDRFADQVNRTLWRLLGADPDHDDLVNEVFLRLINSVRRVRDPRKLRGWVLSITVNTARGELRKRSLRRRFFSEKQPMSESMTNVQDPEARDLLAVTFAVLNRIPADLHVVFALRHIDDRSLEEIAAICKCSLATVKRRLARADKRFAKLARQEPALDDRLRRSSRWGTA